VVIPGTEPDRLCQAGLGRPYFRHATDPEHDAGRPARHLA
jgi:hypothetical protein